jgi:hypothetical protein
MMDWSKRFAGGKSPIIKMAEVGVIHLVRATDGIGES